MSEYVVTKRRLIEGRWYAAVGRADGAALETAPALTVALEGEPVAGVSLTAGEGGLWELVVPVPAEAVSDGLRTIVVQDSASLAVLAGLSLLAGEALDGDLRAEVELLRQELDMLKRAFRRHCVETG
ncbi:hypothetical protein [uncultured Lentibacter sp.]|jgi:hypothetical protein|uniref:hypothetical protein n=1 Tax=uncultured Lentibacter sp. TaxID=1659309 RepID=UPI00262DDED5|nr:hypothetical protein [uncultured Lentibacter sp.]